MKTEIMTLTKPINRQADKARELLPDCMNTFVSLYLPVS